MKAKILIIGASSYVGARLYFDLKQKFSVIGTYSSSQLSKNLFHLGIKITPIDAQDSTFEIFEDDLSELAEFNLPKYTYNQMAKEIVDEIKHRKQFVI